VSKIRVQHGVHDCPATSRNQQLIVPDCGHSGIRWGCASDRYRCPETAGQLNL